MDTTWNPNRSPSDPMKYGGTNDIITKCPRCDQSIDSHKPFPFITSDDTTEALARKLQQSLDDVAKNGKLKGYELPRQAGMVGAAVATINNQVYKFVTISGFNTELLTIMKQNLGKDVVVVTEEAKTLTTLCGEKIAPKPVDKKQRDRFYPVGTCAAQKLLMAVFNIANKGELKKKITKLNMAEILWSDPFKGEHNRDWSTGQIVCSCDTCKQVLPMMLCNAEM